VPIVKMIFTIEDPSTAGGLISGGQELIGPVTVELDLNQRGDTALALAWARPPLGPLASCV
jgi:hypothetical protein